MFSFTRIKPRLPVRMSRASALSSLASRTMTPSADVDAHLAAAPADALGLGQLVVPGFAGQVVRQATATG
jgi:hypothetical protein